MTVAHLGDVLVRGVGLRDRLGLFRDEKDTDEIFAGRLLALCVREPDGAAIYDVAGWDAYAAHHFADALRLFAAARDMCGFGESAAEKK